MKIKDLDTKVMTDVQSYFYHCGIMRVEPTVDDFKKHIEPLISQNNQEWYELAVKENREAIDLMWLDNEKTRYDCGWNSALAELEARLKIKNENFIPKEKKCRCTGSNWCSDCIQFKSFSEINSNNTKKNY